ncbi:MAG: MBL fold metallo-hydrolase, partial [Thermoprotei archaeon]
IKHTVPVVAHPDITKPNIYIGDGQVKLLVGLPFDISEVGKYGGQLLLTKSVLEVVPGIYFLGEIPRVTDFEGVPKGFYTLDGGELVRDELRDDTALAVKVRDLGLIVISGCSHSGIVNIVKYATEVLKEQPYAVIGGLHLISANEERIRKTVNGLKGLGVREVYVGHCTGLRAEYGFLRVYGDKFRKIHSGFRIKFYVKGS